MQVGGCNAKREVRRFHLLILISTIFKHMGADPLIRTEAQRRFKHPLQLRLAIQAQYNYGIPSINGLSPVLFLSYSLLLGLTKHCSAT